MVQNLDAIRSRRRHEAVGLPADSGGADSRQLHPRRPGGEVRHVIADCPMTSGGPSRIAKRTFFDGLVAKRRLFIDGLDANEGEINLNIFEDFYPDHAHFVYELLQNAEDAG